MDWNNVNTDIEAISNDDVFYRKFLNNGDSNMSVDGSVTPIKFTLEDVAEDKFIVSRVDFIISVADVIDVSNFAGLAELTNGVLFNIDGSQVFKTNGDIMLFASDATFESVKIKGQTSGIINGHWDLLGAFQNGLVCKKDSFYVEIRDDLGDVDYYEMSAVGIKIN